MKSSSATHICKVCFKNINDVSLRSFVGGNLKICRHCYEELKPAFIRYKILNVQCLSLYFYDDKIQSLLYQFKGTLDIELKSIFICYARPLLKLYYKGYFIIPVPSSDEINKQRGFNQVEEMFKQLKMPFVKAIYKTKKHIQHEGKYLERKKVKNVLSWVDGVDIKGKKILLVDDVFTTGSTVKACINLIKKHRPKMIKLLTMAKTREINDRNN